MYTARERFDRLRDDGVNAPEVISPIKCDSCGKAPEIARAARDMHGGNGIFMAYGAMRHC